MIAAMASIAAEAGDVAGLFKYTDTNDAGIYGVQLFVNGIKEIVIVDDFVPVYPDSQLPAFATATDESYWVYLVEKAWAKLHGSYANTVAGIPAFAAQHLYGTATWTEDHFETAQQVENKDALWARMHRLDQNGWSVMSGTDSPNGQEEPDNQTGLILGHAYSALQFKEITDDSGSTKRLIQMRNPWGTRGEWNGAWSDSWDGWTDNTKAQVGWEASNDGKFWMNFEDYLTHFASTDFVGELDNARYQHSNIIHRFATSDNEGPIAFYSFELTDAVNAAPDDTGKIDSTFTISVYQQGPKLQNYRKQNSDPAKFTSSTLSVVLMKEDGTYIGSAKKAWFQAPYINEDTNLQPGKYIIAVQALFNDVAMTDQNYQDLNIDIYTNQAVTLTPVKYSNGVSYLAKMFQGLAVNHIGDEHKVKFQETNADYSNNVRITGDNGGVDAPLRIIYTENNSEYVYKQGFTFTRLEGAEVVFPKNLAVNEQLNIEIPAGGNHIMVLRNT